MNPVDMAEEKEIFYLFIYLFLLFFLVSYVGLEIDESQTRGASWRLAHACMLKEGLRGALRIQASWITLTKEQTWGIVRR